MNICGYFTLFALALTRESFDQDGWKRVDEEYKKKFGVDTPIECKVSWLPLIRFQIIFMKYFCNFVWGSKNHIRI